MMIIISEKKNHRRLVLRIPLIKGTSCCDVSIIRIFDYRLATRVRYAPLRRTNIYAFIWRGLEMQRLLVTKTTYGSTYEAIVRLSSARGTLPAVWKFRLCRYSDWDSNPEKFPSDIASSFRNEFCQTSGDVDRTSCSRDYLALFDQMMADINCFWNNWLHKVRKVWCCCLLFTRMRHDVLFVLFSSDRDSGPAANLRRVVSLIILYKWYAML